MNSSNSKLYGRVADLGCILCLNLGLGPTPCEIHHIRRFGGKRDNAPVIGLCPEHHRGNTGVHGLGAKGFEKRYGLTQEFLLELTTELLNRHSAQSVGNQPDF
jgi:hypothetical protein